MADFTIDNNKKLSDLKITQVNYQDNITIQNNSTILTGDNGNYLKFPYPSISTSVLKYNNIDFKITNLYIFGILHTNILGLTKDGGPGKPKNINIIGEFVIEHTDVNGNKLYLCNFISKTGQSTPNIVENAITSFVTPTTKPTEMNVTRFLPSLTTNSNGIVYLDGNKTVVLVTDPNAFVSVSTSSATAIKDYEKYYNDLFSITPSKADASDDQIYIDCNLTGEVLDDTIQYYPVPLNSNANNFIMQTTNMLMSVNFFIFMLIVFIVYFSVPQFYKMYFINYLIKKYNVVNEKAYFGKEIPRYIANADRLACWYILFAILLVILIGININNGTLQFIGILLVPGFVLSYALIENKKINEVEYLKYKTVGTTYTELQQCVINPLDLIRALLGTKELTNVSITNSSGFILLMCYLALLVILFVIIGPLFAVGKISYEEFSTLATMISLFSLPSLFAGFTILTDYIGV